MKGIHEIIVQNRKVKFEFKIERNISIIKGDSATGKTTLVNMIADYQAQGEMSGIQLISDKECVAMVGLGNRWADFIKNTKDSIVFIDEGEKYVSSKDFAKIIKNTDNYYVIVTRNNLYELPYSVDSIYEIKKSGRYGRLKKTYNSFKKIYGENLKKEHNYKSKDIVIVEDNKSGFQFFKEVSNQVGKTCISAVGKGNILKVSRENLKNDMLIIADGAAFGPEIENIYGLSKGSGMELFLPDSFEWLILNSGIIKNKNVKEVLANPSDYIDSNKYFSWEQFYTDYLKKISAGKKYQYTKSKINPFYLSDTNIKKLLGDFFSDYNT